MGSVLKRNQSLLLGKHSVVQATGACGFLEEDGGARRGVGAFISARGFRWFDRETKRLGNGAAGFNVGEIGVFAKTRTWITCTILTTSWSHSETDNNQQR